LHYSYPSKVQLALVSLHRFEHWRDAIGQEWDFRKTGFVRMVHPGETKQLKLNVEMQRAYISRLTTRSELPPGNASTPPSRAAAHDSGRLWFAIASTYETFIHNTLPVLNRRTEHI
jgi:hypothetical protein